MAVVALVCAVMAAVLHIYIFVLESVRWTDERTRRTFGTTAEEAEATREMAFNQGFYNLFLAVITLVGVGLWTVSDAVGAALVYAGAGSMLAAGLVLLISSPGKAKAAITQLFFPLLAVVTVTIALLV
ncbi:DUF1304 domain-containing protein [Gordonia sp. NB41Y]|uniref:DUF1304 domain-containing protein n=1 Tax=Gordonia sp. NB41Y TaxID=875808 RepID=UPI0002BF345D|nr:DUF1304 domain-containing protein [Gordonia sp. NB41Y]EMP15397.1 hypothetical protein ISGA_565 [Gordonia sp. NB41Y]WLP90493.1 DUF1304 domain-containing protein [Gordonia sp. NB41Y]